MEPVRIGIIGIGNMGTGHAQSLAKGAVEGAVLAAVADPRPERKEWIAKNLPADIAQYDDGLAMIQHAAIDAILIATPHYDHPVLAKAAFAKGLHVLTEKPAGVFTKDVHEMNAAAEKSGKIFGIMFQQRKNPRHQKVRELVESGELGDIRRVNWVATDWYRTQSYYDSGDWRATWAGEGGGVLLNQCPHTIDLFWWIPGIYPKRVRAFMEFGKYHDIEVEDDVTAYFEYDNGATGTFVTSTGEAPGANRLEISGDNGRLVLENNKITFHRNRQPVSVHCRTCESGFARPECWTIDIPASGDDTAHNGIIRDFVLAIRENKPLLAPGADGVKGLALSNAMHLSAWTDAWVDLPLDEDRFLQLLNDRRQTSRHKTAANQGGNDDSFKNSF